MNWFLFTTATDSRCKTFDLCTVNSTAARKTHEPHPGISWFKFQQRTLKTVGQQDWKDPLWLVNLLDWLLRFHHLLQKDPTWSSIGWWEEVRKKSRLWTTQTTGDSTLERYAGLTYKCMKSEKWEKHSLHDGKPQQPHSAAKWWRELHPVLSLRLSEKKVWSLNTETVCVPAGSKGDGPQSSGSASIRIRTAAIDDQSQISSLEFTNT